MTTFVEKLKLFTSNIWTFLEPFIETLLSSAGQALANAAITAVTSVAQDPGLLTDDAKRQAAFQAIVKDLAGKGIQMGVSTINAALETAVLKMKAKTPAAPTS